MLLYVVLGSGYHVVGNVHALVVLVFLPTGKHMNDFLRLYHVVETAPLESRHRFDDRFVIEGSRAHKSEEVPLYNVFLNHLFFMSLHDDCLMPRIRISECRALAVFLRVSDEYGQECCYSNGERIVEIG